MTKEDNVTKLFGWNCHSVTSYYGWEAERVVALIDAMDIVEPITRARTHLAVILSDIKTKSTNLMHLNDFGFLEQNRKYFLQAADLGLIEIVELGAKEVVEIKQQQCAVI